MQTTTSTALRQESVPQFANAAAPITEATWAHYHIIRRKRRARCGISSRARTG